MYRLFIERTGREYVRVSLQRKGKRWKTQEVEYCSEGNTQRLQLIVAGYSAFYKIEPHNVIDTRYDYQGVSWMRAIWNELKLSLENYIWKKKFLRLKKELTFIHENSGKTQKTRRKYWIMTDDMGNPIAMTSAYKDELKRKGWYSKQVDFMTLNKECLWSTDNLYS